MEHVVEQNFMYMLHLTDLDRLIIYVMECINSKTNKPKQKIYLP